MTCTCKKPRWIELSFLSTIHIGHRKLHEHVVCMVFSLLMSSHAEKTPEKHVRMRNSNYESKSIQKIVMLTH